MTKTRLFALLLTLVVLLAACGGDGDSPDESAVDGTSETTEQAGQPGQPEQEQADIDGAADGSGVEMKIVDSTVEGTTAVLTMEVSGIEIVPADGDTSGSTGHFHVFVNTPPVQEGVVIAQGTGVAHTADNPVRFPDLPPGEHTLTVVIGDGNHARILPGVEAKTTVTIE